MRRASRQRKIAQRPLRAGLGKVQACLVMVEFMVSPTYVRKVGNDKVGVAPALTGPFRFVERIPGERIVVERNPDYGGTPSKLAKIIFRPMADVAVRVAALRAGESDIAQNPLPWSSKAELEQAGVTISSHLTVWALKRWDGRRRSLSHW